MKFLEKLKDNITQKKWTLFTVLVIFCCYFIMGLPVSKGIHYITGVAVLFIPIIVFSRVRSISIILSIILSTIISLEVSYYIIFSERPSPAILTAAQTVTVDMALKVTGPILIYAIPLFFGFCTLFIASAREISKASLKSCLVSLFFCILIPTSTFLMASYRYFQNTEVPEVLKTFIRDKPLDFLKEIVYVRYPLVFGDVIYVLADIYWLNQIKTIPARTKLYEGISLSNDEDQPIATKIVLIIGESSVYDHYEIYGYPFNTTPHLTTLLQQKKIMLVDDVISPAAITRDSLRLTLSFATPSNLDVFFKKKNIIEMAKQAGYETIWLSATTEKGLASSYLDLLSRSSQVMLDSSSLLISNQQKGKPEDLVLLPIFRKYLEKGKKQFIVLHLEGSHIYYKDRYDEEDEQLITTKDNTDYDRTIHHTDRVVNNVISELIKLDDNVILFYFSDHGEIVNKGHGLKFSTDKQYRVPFIFYQNGHDPLMIKELIESYRSSNGYFNLMNTKYIIGRFMGFQISSSLIKQARLEGETVFHADQEVYKFMDIQSGDKPDR